VVELASEIPGNSVSNGLDSADAAADAPVEVLTELKRALEAAIVAKAEAEELSRVKSVVLSNFTNELRTPLHSMLGFSALLADALAEGETQDYARSIQTSGKRMLATLTSLIEFAALESRPNDLVLYPMPLAEVLESLIEPYRSHIEQRGLELVLDVPQANAIVLLNEDRLKRAFERIMANAIKFTHQGGIRVELGEEVRACSYGPPQERAVIRVRDTGIGMSPEFAARAFDKFKQESNGIRGYEGIGIGLPLARGYVRQMNGDMGLTSEAGMGTEVWMSFPIVAKAAHASRIPASRSGVFAVA